MIKLHHLEHSRSQRIAWLLEELELPYEVVLHHRDKQTELAPQSLRDVHPLGKAPVLVDGELVIAESGAIIEYLIKKSELQALRPSNNKGLRQYNYWMHFAEGSLMPLLVMHKVFDRIENAHLPWFIRWFVRPVAKGISGQVKNSFLKPNLKRQATFINEHLSGNTWFCGSELTGADFMMSFPLEALHKCEPSLTHKQPIEEFVSRIQSRPAYKKALKRGGPYAFLA